MERLNTAQERLGIRSLGMRPSNSISDRGDPSWHVIYMWLGLSLKSTSLICATIQPSSTLPTSISSYSLCFPLLILALRAILSPYTLSVENFRCVGSVLGHCPCLTHRSSLSSDSSTECSSGYSSTSGALSCSPSRIFAGLACHVGSLSRAVYIPIPRQ